MCTLHSVIAFDVDSTTYRRVDGDSAVADAFTFIVVDCHTRKAGHGQTEKQARAHLRLINRAARPSSGE